MTLTTDRRGFLAAAGALAAGAMTPRLAMAAGTRLRVYWWGSQPRADRTFKVMEMYTKGHSGVTLDGETAGWSDYWPRLATQVAGRNAPDVIQMDYRYIFEYARRGALANMDDLRAQMPLDGFPKAVLDGGSVDGKLYGISLGANSAAIMANTQALQKAGVTLPDTFTFDQMKEMAKGFKTTDDVPYFSADLSGVEPVLENWLRQQGKALYDADGQLGFGAAEIEAWFDLWDDLRAAGVTVTPDLQALYQQSIETSMVTLGHSALDMAHTNQFVGFVAVNTAPLEMRPLPLVHDGATGGQYRKPSQFFSISARAEDKKVAADFINYFVTDLDAAKVLDVERGVPESDKVRAAIAPMLDPTARAAVDFIGKLGDLVGPLPPPPPKGAGEIEKSLIRISQEVGFGRTKAKDGAAQLVSEAQSILARG